MLTGTNVTLTCDVSGISVNSSVLWKNEDGNDVTVSSNAASYNIVSGTYNSTAGKQSFELGISGNANDVDANYTCEITPNGGTAQPTTVTLDVFSKFIIFEHTHAILHPVEGMLLLPYSF